MALKLDVPKGPKGVSVLEAYFQIAMGGFEAIEGALHVSYVLDMYLSAEACRDNHPPHWSQKFTIPYPAEPQDLLAYLYAHTKSLQYQEQGFEIDFQKAVDAEEIYPLPKEDPAPFETVDIKPPLSVRLERKFMEGLLEKGSTLPKEKRWELIQLKANIETALSVGDFENVIDKIQTAPDIPVDFEPIRQSMLQEIHDELGLESEAAKPEESEKAKPTRRKTNA